ncbi:MAG: arsenic efflux protein [Bacteroidales bacterium]|nr:arsenic efflux protein [Bacteroidales bacterium]
MWHVVVEALRNAVLITGLVVVMMMMIESLNIESRGMVFKGLKKTKFGQVVIASLLGSIPGCMGGFATVSLYTHRMFSFGALVAMMIASSGDEAFVMLAMIPEQALILFAVLFVLAILVGVAVDFVHDRMHSRSCDKHDHSECGADTDCHDGYVVHDEHIEHYCSPSSVPCGTGNRSKGECSPYPHGTDDCNAPKRHYGWKRMLMFAGLAVFISALATGRLGHDHSAHAGHDHGHEGHVHTEACEHGHHHHEEDIQSHGIDLLSEDWMNVIFAGLSVIVLFVLLFASDHFVEGHLWEHIVKRHLPTIFAWTLGVLLVLGFALQYVEIDHWISDNTALMILLATLIGIIPESGPHMIFVTLFATGVVPFPVLLASSISQDGHASIPLLAESRKSFAWAKLINCVVALAAGFGAMLLM